KISNIQLLSTLVENWIILKFFGKPKGFEGVSKGFSAGGKATFDYLEKKLFVTVQSFYRIAGQPYHSRVDLWRRIENSRRHGEQIFDVIPSLQENRQNPILFASLWRSNPFCHFLLQHADDLGDTV